MTRCEQQPNPGRIARLSLEQILAKPFFSGTGVGTESTKPNNGRLRSVAFIIWLIILGHRHGEVDAP